MAIINILFFQLNVTNWRQYMSDSKVGPRAESVKHAHDSVYIACQRGSSKINTLFNSGF